MVEIQCVAKMGDVLGEAPLWNMDERALYWTDNIDPRIHRYDPANGSTRTWIMPEEIGSFGFRKKGGLVAGARSGFCFIDLERSEIDKIADPESDKPGNRFNDGKCDRHGRFWCSTMHAGLSRRTAGIYKLDTDLSVSRMDPEFSFISGNGIAFSPDNKTMYFADTRGDTVYRYDYDKLTGAIANRRVFFSTEGIVGRVDGATVDTEGNYWCALVGGWRVLQVDPSGKIVREIEMAVQRPTCTAFGGESLDVLYVTSGTIFMQPEDFPKQPLAGSLFAIHGLGAKGLPEPDFEG